MYRIVYTKKALSGIPLLKAVGLEKKAKTLIELVRKNPYKASPELRKVARRFRRDVIAAH